MIRMKFDTDSAAVILTRLRAQGANSRDLNRNTITGEDVAIRSCENAKFVNSAAF